MAFGDFTVTRASTKLRIGSNGLYGSVANNVPAFEFNTDGTYRGLLVEPGATNIILRSQEFQTTWAVSNATITTNATASPDGTTTAEKLVEDSSSGVSHSVSQTLGTFDGRHTLSVYAKKAERSFLVLRTNLADNTSRNTFFNLDTGAVGTVGTGHTALIEFVGNGWYRCSISANATVSGARFMLIAVAETDNVFEYTGDGTSGIFIWQAQHETGSVATSPIVTTAGTASRVADVVSLTGASSLIGQTEGTVFAEIDTRNLVAPKSAVSITAGADILNVIELWYGVSSGFLTSFSALIRTNSGTFGQVNTGAISAVGRYRLCATYSSGLIKLFVNGALIGSANASQTTFSASLDRISIGSRLGTLQLNDNARSVAVFPTALSDAQAITLTTL
jgi:hypothetical protein